MSEGMYGEIHVAGPFICRMSEVSKETTVESASWPAGATGDIVAVEFTAPLSVVTDDAGEIFHHEQKTIYRVTHSLTEGLRCVRELIGGYGCPVCHFEVDCGAVVLSFVAADLESFRDIVINSKLAFGGVSPRWLTQSEPDSVTGSLVLVNHDKLMVRRREAFGVIRGMDYFEHPCEANTTEAAMAFDINRPAFTKYPSAAQSKLLDMAPDV